MLHGAGSAATAIDYLLHPWAAALNPAAVAAAYRGKEKKKETGP
jgi:hypothetical protein